MDYLRKFIETAFYYVDCKFTDRLLPDNEVIDETTFMQGLRLVHPELSDDIIRLVYKKFCDEWCLCPHVGTTDKNIFNSLLYLVDETLVVNNEMPQIKFEKLFKWRETTELIGETLPICAFLAYQSQYGILPRTAIEYFSWANVLPTDNRRLYYYFETIGLLDLHNHLKASTSVFLISWVCLMNSVVHRNGQFGNFANDKKRANELYNAVTLAAMLRITLFRKLFDKSYIGDMYQEIGKSIRNGLDKELQSVERLIIDERDLVKQHQHCFIYDYASKENFHPMGIFMGERRLLYYALKHIYSGDEYRITPILYRYIIIKAKFRKEIVQLNKKAGFANLSDFEQKKEIFLKNKKRYSDLLFTLPLYEAQNYYFQDYIETRIAPQGSYAELRKRYNYIVHLNKGKMVPDYRLIYHFIKQKGKNETFRNESARNKVDNETNAINVLLGKASVDKVVGIDAANSEFFCRPEVFAEAFKSLSKHGKIRRTYHVGEDFYDIVDGLRAIDEAITFLNLQRGDRLGHCLALGISPEKYYSERNNHLAIPRQVLLDDMVWLYMKAMELCITIPPSIKRQIFDVFNKFTDKDVNINEYYDSMVYRRQNPKTVLYNDQNKVESLFFKYHYDIDSRNENLRIEDFTIDCKYAELVFFMQEKMMDEIEKRQLSIECCPSSNYKIGYMDKFEEHPIFRFCNVKNDKGHHLPVTINTDDLGIFYTSLPREFELVALSLLKAVDANSMPIYNSQEVYDWIERIIKNAHIYKFG